MSLIDEFTKVQSSVTASTPGASEIVAAAQKLYSYLPSGKLRDVMTNAKNFYPGGILIGLLKSKKFNSGEYWLGEKFMNHVLDMHNITKRSSVPDDYVPAAKIYFSACLGVPINTGDDLYALMSSVDYYLDRDKNQKFRELVPYPDAIRARSIIGLVNDNIAHWDLEAAAAKFPVSVVIPETVNSIPVSTYQEIPVDPVPRDDTANVDLMNVDILPSWWYRALWILVAIGLIVFIAVGSFAGSRTKRRKFF